MADTKSDLPEKIVQWLETQGYRLEMTVAHALQQANFDVSLSDYYTDTDTKELREIDVTANRWSRHDEGFELQVCARIECKTSKDKPWIVFVPQTQHDDWFPPFYTICSDQFWSFWMEAFKRNEFEQQMRSISLFNPRCVGYGVTQGFTTGQDVAYKAIMSSVKACIHRTAHINELFDAVVNDKPRNTLSITFPAIIIDGKLYECQQEKSNGKWLCCIIACNESSRQIMYLDGV